MSQSIKYESTTIDPTQSAAEIAALVQKYGGSRFEMMWDEFARLVGIRFAIRHERLGEVPVRLMAQIENVTAYVLAAKPWNRRMRRRAEQYKADVRAQAYRIAWRQLRDFVEQSLLAVETGLFPLHEAFMAQIETPDPATGESITVGELFERHAVLESSGLRLLQAPVVEGEYEVEP